MNTYLVWEFTCDDGTGTSVFQFIAATKEEVEQKLQAAGHKGQYKLTRVFEAITKEDCAAQDREEYMNRFVEKWKDVLNDACDNTDVVRTLELIAAKLGIIGGRL